MHRLLRLVVPLLVGALAGCNSSSNALVGEQAKRAPVATERSIKDFAASNEAIAGDAPAPSIVTASPAAPPPAEPSVGVAAGRGGGGVGVGSIGTKGYGAAETRSRGPMPSRPGKRGLLVDQKPAEPADSDGAPEGNTHVDHGVNPFVETRRDALSTFAVDVDTASYAIARRTSRAPCASKSS
jgi:Ca-activated chloride channel family protein